MRYLTRKEVMDKLRLSQSASYRIVGTSRCPLVSSRDVVLILNNSRFGGQGIIAEIPEGGLVTCDEVAERIGCGVTAHNVMCWTRRLLNPVPHFRLNSHCRRFDLSAVERWLDSRSQIVRRG